MRRLRAVLITLLPVAALAQPADRVQGQIEAETAERIAALDKRAEELTEFTESEKQWIEACGNVGCYTAAPGIREKSERARAERAEAMDAVAFQIHGEIDAYIGRAVRTDRLDPAAVGQNLKRILGKTAWGATSAFVISVGGTPSLVAAYTLSKGGRMGAGTTSVTVRVYAVSEGSFRLVAAAGGDLDGCADLSLVQLHSPIPNQMWVLLTGRLTGANGPHNEMQIYAYDGAKFRPVWADDEWGDFTVRATDRGFTVDGPYYTAASGIDHGVRHDNYYLAEDGAHRVSP
jgi:hypothetical protein